MQKPFVPNWLHYCIACVWMINGLFCKVLNLVPRHEAIVERIVNTGHARLFTLLIDLAEIGMALWILTGIQKRLNVVTQILIIASMNTLEFFLVPGLLLWGRANSVFAFLFIVLIYYNEFHYPKKSTQQTACFLF